MRDIPNYELALSLYQHQTKNLNEIAAILDVKPSTVRLWARSERWDKKRVIWARKARAQRIKAGGPRQ